jgi:hypothetical protein
MDKRQQGRDSVPWESPEWGPFFARGMRFRRL